MLGHTYRYQVYNGTAVSVTVTAKTRAWKLASDGARTDDTEATRIDAASVGTLAYSTSATVDNSSVKNVGAKVIATFAPASSATGLVVLFLQVSTDGGTTWPSDGAGDPVCSQYFAASSTSVTVQGEV